MCDIDWTALSSIATALAAIGTLLTVIEMKKHRIDSMKPELVLLTTALSLEVDINSDIINSNWFSITKKGDSLIREPFGLYFTNIGLGPAKKIEIEWLYNTDEILTSFEKLKTSTVLSFKGNGFIGNDSMMINSTADKQSSLNLCLTANSQPEGFKTTMPYLLQFLLTETMKSFFESKEEKRDICGDSIKSLLGANKIKVSYKDLQNNKYTKIFSIQIDMTMFSLNKFSGRISEI